MTLNNSQPPASPDNNDEISHFEDEIDIIDLIRPLWQQKILIAAITFTVIALAVILVLRATPQYKIYTQLKSGTYRWDKNGAPIRYMKTSDLKNLLGGGIFETYTKQAGFKDHAPKISIASTRGGDQLTASIFWPDPNEGKKILSGYVDFLNQTDRNNSNSQTSGLQNQRNALQKSIKGINADLNMTKKAVNFLNEQIKVADETRIGYEKRRQEIDTNTTKIISLRDKLLQTPPDDTLQLLLMASTIQQNIAYLSTIDQKIEAARKEVISYRTKIAELAKTEEKSRLSIADLNEKIKTIALVETIESPQASTRPVNPNKKKIVALAGVMGGFMAILCAYCRHFWLTNRERLTDATSNA